MEPNQKIMLLALTALLFGFALCGRAHAHAAIVPYTLAQHQEHVL